jgi:hypothetical protein
MSPMAHKTVDEDAALVRAALAYLHTMHQEAAAVVVALEAAHAPVSPKRRAAKPGALAARPSITAPA